ncbi:MAG: DsbA family protein [Sphingomonadaceae bacterium]
MKKLPLLGALGAVALAAGVAAVGAGRNDNAYAQSPESDTAKGERIRHEIQNDPVAPTIAPEGHDVTVVVFSDYQCPYCRKIHPVLEELMRKDRKVKLVYRDWPIFGAASTEAARAAIAAQYQGRHAAFNDALMQTQGRLNSKSIRTAADRAGVDWARLQADLKTHRTEIDQLLSRSSRYAAMMDLAGTPALLVGSYLIPGGVDIGPLREAVTLARTQERTAQAQ